MMTFVISAISSIVYVFFIIPANLILRIFGKDPLSRKWDKNARTYWLAPERGKAE